jgi:4-hydroxy 2-oxovalerate aldolase
VGFHGHENLGLGVANSVEAVRAGAKQIDGSVRRFGAGAGNAPVEALIAVFDKIGVKTGIDFFEIADAAEEVVAPAMPAECLLDRNALIMGYSGVYSSFLKHAVRQGERYGVPAHQLLHRAGQRKLIGGQEDQLIALLQVLPELRKRRALLIRDRVLAASKAAESFHGSVSTPSTCERPFSASAIRTTREYGEVVL